MTSQRGKTTLRGHALRSEGKPYDPTGTEILFGADGRAKCECGAMSDVLESDGQRKRWHRWHKDEERSS